MFKLLKYALYDIVKSRFALLYTLFMVLVAISIYQVSEDMSKVSLSLLIIMLMIVPLISAIFATTHFFNNLEFTELMLAQPVKRRDVFLSQILAVIFVLSMAILIGFGAPMLLWGADASVLILLGIGIGLSVVFAGLAFLASVCPVATVWTLDAHDWSLVPFFERSSLFALWSHPLLLF